MLTPMIFSHSVCFRITFAISCLLLTYTAPTAHGQAEPLLLMPVPFKIQKPEAGSVELHAPLITSFRHSPADRLFGAVVRFQQRLEQHAGFALNAEHEGVVPLKFVIDCDVDSYTSVKSSADNREAYQLTVTDSAIHLHAQDWLGVDRGLATLLQLIQVDGQVVRLPKVAIEDHPRLPWRGLMIDTVRNWLPENLIERTLDAMEETKLNVLHLHIFEQNVLRVADSARPAKFLPVDHQQYTREQIQNLVAYAHQRGIQVIPGYDLTELLRAKNPFEEIDHLLAASGDAFPDGFIGLCIDEKSFPETWRLWTFEPRPLPRIADQGTFAPIPRVVDALNHTGKKAFFYPTRTMGSYADRGPIAARAAGAKGSTASFNIESPQIRDEIALTKINAISRSSPATVVAEAWLWNAATQPQTLEQRLWPRAAIASECFWSSDIPEEDIAFVDHRVAAVRSLLQDRGMLTNRPMQFEGYHLNQPSNEYSALVIIADAVEALPDGQPTCLTTTRGSSSELVDWASLDSPIARAFDKTVLNWIDSGNTDQAPERPIIETQLGLWSAAAQVMKTFPADSLPAPQARVNLATRLSQLCENASKCLRSINHERLSSVEAARFYESINRADVDRSAGVTFPFLSALRLLVAAASETQADHPGSETQWRQYLDTVVRAHTHSLQP